MRTTVALLVLLTAIWAALSGHYSTEPLIFSFGVLSLTVVVWLALRMDRISGDQGFPPEAIGQTLRLPRYLLFLFVEVVKSNLHVSRLILGDRSRVAQKLLVVKASQRTLLGQVAHANSITLTPGTITLDLRDSHLLVHAIDQTSADGIIDGVIDRAATRLEGDATAETGA